VASWIGDAHQVERVAGAYDDAAHEIAHIGRQRESEIERADWEAPSADRHRSAARERRRACEHAANEMQEVARALRRHAAWIRERESELRSLEARIRAWAAAHPPNPADPFPDASLITYWPPPLSPDWESLAARLRANGVYF
jgi:hypothetical protein